MRVHFLGVPIDRLTLDETVSKATESMLSRKRCQHVALNVAKLVNMQKNVELSRDVIESDIVGVDGMGIVLGGRLLGLKLSRVAGIDLFERLLEVCAEQGFRPFLLGASEPVLEMAISNIKEKHPTLNIAGCHHGYFKPEDEQEVVDLVRKANADCLFIALPTPRKERLLASYRDKFAVPFIMGVGGSFDVLAGVVSRSPLWMQAVGLEWFFRFCQEPRRMFWRYFSTNILFAVVLSRALPARVRQQFQRD